MVRSKLGARPGKPQVVDKTPAGRLDYTPTPALDTGDIEAWRNFDDSAKPWPQFHGRENSLSADVKAC